MSPPPPGPASHLHTDTWHMTQSPYSVPAKQGAIAGAEVKSWGCTQSFRLCPGPFTRQETKRLGCASGSWKAEPLWAAGRVHFLEASVRDWREPVSTNGYGNSELNALGGDAQVFRPML